MELWEAWSYGTKLQGRETTARTGKREPFGELSRTPEGDRKAHPSNSSARVCPVAPTGGYRLSGSIGGEQISWLLDTGAAVTLLREDAWRRLRTKQKFPELKPWSSLKLVGAGGDPLTIHGSAHIELELGGGKFEAEVVVVSPLTSEAILGLDFLQKEKATIDLTSKVLQLKQQGKSLPLEDPDVPPPLGIHKVSVCAMDTVELPPCSEIEVLARIPAIQGLWVLQESLERPPPVAVA